MSISSVRLTAACEKLQVLHCGSLLICRSYHEEDFPHKDGPAYVSSKYGRHRAFLVLSEQIIPVCGWSSFMTDKGKLEIWHGDFFACVKIVKMNIGMPR